MKNLSISKKIVLVILTVFMALSVLVGLSSMNTASALAEEPSFNIVTGAGIRTSKPAGIRFTAEFNKAKYDEIIEVKGAEPVIKEGKRLGMFIVPDRYYDEFETYKKDNAYSGTFYEYCKTVKHIVDFTYSADQIVEVDGKYFIKGSLVNIMFNNIDLKFNAFAYIETTVGEEVSYEIVFDRLNARSVSYVASAALNDNIEDTDGFMVDILNKTGYKKLGVVYNHETNKYDYNGQSFDTLEAIGIDPVSAFALNTKLAYVNVNKTLNVKGEKLNDVSVKWETSDPQVATVEDGVITGVKNGVAEITATVGAIVNKVTVNVDVISDAAPVVLFDSQEKVNTLLSAPKGTFAYSEDVKFNGAGTVKIDSKAEGPIPVQFNISDLIKNNYQLCLWVYNANPVSGVVNIGWATGDLSLPSKQWTCVHFSDSQIKNGGSENFIIWAENGVLTDGGFYISSIYSADYVTEKETPVVDFANIGNIINKGSAIGQFTYSEEVKFGKNGMLKVNNEGVGAHAQLWYSVDSSKLNGCDSFYMWIYNGNSVGALINIGWKTNDKYLFANSWNLVQFNAEALLNGPAIDMWMEDASSMNGLFYISSIYANN